MKGWGAGVRGGTPVGPRVRPLTSWCPCGEPLVGDRWTERAPSSRPPCSSLPSVGVSYLLPSHSLLPTWIHGSHLAWKCHGLNRQHLEREPLVPTCVRASSLLGICVQRCLQGEPPPPCARPQFTDALATACGQPGQSEVKPDPGWPGRGTSPGSQAAGRGQPTSGTRGRPGHSGRQQQSGPQLPVTSFLRQVGGVQGATARND